MSKNKFVLVGVLKVYNKDTDTWSFIPNNSSRRRWVENATPRRETWYPLDRRMGGPQSLLRLQARKHGEILPNTATFLPLTYIWHQCFCSSGFHKLQRLWTLPKLLYESYI